jgi:hypothetical protein
MIELCFLGIAFLLYKSIFPPYAIFDLAVPPSSIFPQDDRSTPKNQVFFFSSCRGFSQEERPSKCMGRKRGLAQIVAYSRRVSPSKGQTAPG